MEWKKNKGNGVKNGILHPAAPKITIHGLFLVFSNNYNFATRISKFDLYDYPKVFRRSGFIFNVILT